MKLIYPILILALLGACQSKDKKQNDKTKEKIAVQKTPAKTTINTDAFFQAALDGNLVEVKRNIEQGLDANTTEQDGHTAIMFASYNGHTAIAKYLIEKNANVNQSNTNDRTALMLASSGPFNETVVTLLNAGAELNKVDNIEHFTALMFAASEGQMAVVKTLLDRGADKSLVDIDGDSARDFAIQKGHLKVAEFILAY